MKSLGQWMQQIFGEILNSARAKAATAAALIGFGIAAPAFAQLAVMAPMNYRIDCHFEDKSIPDQPACDAAINYRENSDRGSKENTFRVFCSKDAPLYKGEGTVLKSGDLATIRTLSSENPTLVLPRQSIESTSQQEVSASLNLNAVTMLGSCDVRPSVN